MSWKAICAVLFLACHISHACVLEEDVFVTKLRNITVSEGEPATFRCRANSSLIGFQYIWGYTLVGQGETVFMSINEFDIVEVRMDDVELRIPSVPSKLNGALFRCSIRDTTTSSSLKDQICSSLATPTIFGTLSVNAPPVISLSTSSYSVATQENLLIQVPVSGNPKPSVSLYILLQNGGEMLVSDGSNPRLTITYATNGVYNVTFSAVRRADMGMYRMVASNNLLLNANKTFSVDVTGVDPPEVKVDPHKVVAPYGASINLNCGVQPDGYDMSTVIEWKDRENNVVSQDTTRDLHMFSYSNGTVRLTIKTLSSDFEGMYICTAKNGMFLDSKTTMVYGPPPSPAAAGIKVTTGSTSVSIQWNRPQQSTIITQYRVTIYSSVVTSMVVQSEVTKMYPQDHSTGSITLSDLQPGKYEFTVTALAGTVMGTEGQRMTFTVDAPFPLPVVVGAAVGGLFVIVILLLLVIVCAYCCCKYNARRKQLRSQQQRWNSDEEKMASQPQGPAVMNTYTTALALTPQCDLPPSPMSPMTSAMGIDPKWEFPRENIVLLDELAVGQFTVLYKATARGLRDNRSCDVTVKSLRDGATEDDLKALIYEMDMLATIEEHPNIVSLLRVCSVGQPVFMVMEYMCHGDLLGFLRSCRGHRGMYAVSPGPRYQPPTLQLCSRDMLNMATKIANGMRFLADRKIVHRALCAKNILVGTGMDVKICNVGSFDIPIDTGENLVKWMAPETLFDGTNTTYSDVWSFGVTMWELITIGGTPYAEVPAEELYPQLQSGMRMACPPHCAQEVYDIVNACWEKNPLDRPHFAIIHENLDELVMSKLSYLDLRSYDSQAYSDFDKSLPKSTPL